MPLPHEVDFLLDTAGGYLARRPSRADILSLFTGIRPLVRAGDASSTAALSRDHTILISKSGLLTITGGKWTTYRKMAEDAVDHAVVLARLPDRPCVTRDLHLHGFHRQAGQFGPLAGYGSDAVALAELMQEEPSLAAPLHPALPICGACVVWAARHEMARTVDDVLSRRTRALYLNAAAAVDMAPTVARLLAAELDHSAAWQQQQVDAFKRVAAGFLPPR
jgi:glycerol-3-phosphate dehydrogenase